jgi:integrase
MPTLRQVVSRGDWDRPAQHSQILLECLQSRRVQGKTRSNKMKGHIRERSPGHWAIVIDHIDAQGKRRRKWHSFIGGKRQAQIECAQLVAQRRDGGDVDPSRETVAQYLDRWLEHMRAQVSPRTHERYAELCRKSIAPLVGGESLTKLQPVRISQAYAQALASGRRDGRGGLSPRTVIHIHRVLRGALQQALRWRLIARNPADAVKPPRVERREMKALDIGATVDLIEAATGTSLLVLILLCVLCGLRRGEAAALRWRSVDLDRAQLSVVASVEQTDKGSVREKETKSGKHRSVALSQFVVEELRRHRVRQAEGLLKIGIKLAADHHVVAREDGLPMQPRSLSQAFRKFLRVRGINPVRLHDLRHSHATHMLASGVHPKIAQERLGHSSVSVTIDLYSHVLPGMQAEAVNRVDATLRDALDRRGRSNW